MVKITKIEIHLKKDNDSFRFPVIPSEITLDGSAIYDSESIIKKGEAIVYGGSNLQEINWSTFFPIRYTSYCDYKGFPTPLECCKKIKKWQDEGAVLRLIITGLGINLQCVVMSFSQTRQDATGDLYYQLSLKEYRPIEIPKVTNKNSSSSSQNNSRPQTQPTKKRTHKVVKGDSLWAIAQKYYGKGSLYPKIKEANWNTYPELKKSNVIYTRMTLVIP